LARSRWLSSRCRWRAPSRRPRSPQAALTAEQVAKGRQMFTDNGCVACHTLADAGSAGTVGPSFDGDASLDKSRAISVISNGQGPMPNFGWLGEEDIDLIASYIVQVKK
jgi:mono/diheme cytochrome c family protein